MRISFYYGHLSCSSKHLKLNENYAIFKQTKFMLNHDTNYAQDELVTIPLSMKFDKQIQNNKIELFTQEVANYPGIKNAGVSFSSPSSVGCFTADVSWEGAPPEKEKDKIIWNWESVSNNFFETIGVKILLGRDFSPGFENDIVNWDKGTCSFILNETAVEMMGLKDPIGKEFRVWGLSGPIVGIVDDYHQC